MESRRSFPVLEGKYVRNDVVWESNSNVKYFLRNIISSIFYILENENQNSL